MRYAEFLNKIYEETEVDIKTLRKIFKSIPNILWELEENENVRTPLGAFKKARKKGKRSVLPNGREVPARSKTVIQLKEGTNLIRKDPVKDED